MIATAVQIFSLISSVMLVLLVWDAGKKLGWTKADINGAAFVMITFPWAAAFIAAVFLRLTS